MLNSKWTYYVVENYGVGEMIRSDELANNFDSNYDPQYIEPRVRQQKENLLRESGDSFVDEVRQNEKKSGNVPNEFEEEISHFRIPARLPKRIERNRKKKKLSTEKKKKIKKRKPKKEVMVMEEDEDELNHQEEEEETEEKKEKVHKVTIKKKRPFKNSSYSNLTSPNTPPYRTIVESNYGASNTPIKLRKPVFYKMKTSPMILKENVEVLHPNYHFNHHQKGIKPRDVNFILRTKNKNPRIFIRRYKPYINTFAYPFLHHRSPVHRSKRKKRRRKYKKRKKYQKPLEVETNFIPNNPYSASQVSCNNEPPVDPVTASYPILTNVGTGFDTTSHYESFFPYSSPNDYQSVADKFSTFSQPLNEDYVNEPYDQYHYPAEPFTKEPFQSSSDYTTYPDLTEQAVSKEEPLTIGYDVKEHSNTEELAANHKKETDETLDDENKGDDTQYEDGDGEVVDANADNVEYENDREATAEAEDEEEDEESEETNPRIDSFFEATKQKPIKKTDRNVY